MSHVAAHERRVANRAIVQPIGAEDQETQRSEERHMSVDRYEVTLCVASTGKRISTDRADRKQSSIANDVWA